MSSSSLSAYLAKNYLTADQPEKKKKKKKRTHEASSGLTIHDDDDFATTKPKTANSDDDESAPTRVGGIVRTFKKTTKSNWIVANEASDSAAADAILAANTDGQTHEDDGEDAPAVVVERMSSGAHAGLQTAEQVGAQLAAAARAEAARFAAADPKESGKGQETIYRDASGRIVNIAMARADARRAAAEAEKKERDIKEGQKGDVQKRLAVLRKQELDDARYMPMARYKDDKAMNEEMKAKEIWNDPAAVFLSKRKEGGGGYAGASLPNRFGIRPGKKWDGVDRGNGFEKKWLQAQNRKRENKERAYTNLVDID